MVGRGRRRRSDEPRGWGARGRGTSPPRAEVEEIEVHTRDGAALRAWIAEPAEGREIEGTFVLAHALFARASSFGREGRLGARAALLERGYRTITFDFRGHGASRAPRPWRYDDLVRHDLPALVELARAKAESDGDHPVFVLGHSLGGHVALAAQGTGRMQADGILLVATNLWMPEIEPSRIRRLAKQAFAHVTLPVVTRTETVPVRRFGLASDDAPSDVVRDILEFALGARWRSDDGEDYLAALANVVAPVAAIVSKGDHLMCTTSAGTAFARRCSGPVQVYRVTQSDDGGPPPGHMALATTSRARLAIQSGATWLSSQARP